MPEIKPGVYRDISNTDYHAGKGLGASHLRELLRSPLHYMTSINTPSKETPAMKLGTAVHCAILEPEHFEIEYIKAGDDYIQAGMKKTQNYTSFTPAV